MSETSTRASKRPRSAPSGDDESSYHPKYSSAGDIVFTSKEDDSFRIKSFYVQAHSAVLRDMMSSTTPSGDHAASGPLTDSPVPLDATTDAVRVFLDVVKNEKPDRKTSFDTLDQVLYLCDSLDCPTIRDLLLNHLAVNAALSPWKAFCIGARCNYITVAKAAIACMDTEKEAPPHKQWCTHGMTPGIAEQCHNISFLLGFLRAVTDSRLPNPEIKQLYTVAAGTLRWTQYRYDWEQAARSFAPALDGGVVKKSL